MLHDPTRHENLQDIAWDADRARDFITRVVADSEARYTEQAWWPPHPLDLNPSTDAPQALPPMYHGACGVVWALHYLQAVGAVQLQRSYLGGLADLLQRNHTWLGDSAEAERGAYMMGETPIRLLEFDLQGTPSAADKLAELIQGNLQNPARELMWGSPGTLLAALHLHQRTADARWAELFRTTASTLWKQLLWSEEMQCHYWTQDLYGKQYTFIDGVHGFVGTALPLIRGRHLLAAEDWAAWQTCIETTVQRTATWEEDRANWRAQLLTAPTNPLLMQYCHGAPGFVICLANLPGQCLDALLLAAGEAVWAAGPLSKGSNLCHGTGGNGYTFLKLYKRTGDSKWLQRARAFAMHGIAQTEAHAQQYGQLRYSLWTGDPGFAIYVWDCLHGRADFPTLDVFYGEHATIQAANTS